MEISTGQFNDSYFPVIDSVGMTTHNYAFWLNKKYGSSIAVAPKVKGYKDLTDYKVYRFKSVILPGMNPYRVGLPLVDFSFKKSLKKIKFDLLHAHCPFISGHLALRIAKKQNIPLVTTFHSKYREDFRKILNNELLVDFFIKSTLDFYQKADHVWVPNKSTGQILKEYGYSGKFTVVPNGTDMEPPEKTELIRFRKKGLEEIGANPNEFILLFAGQHRWEKNVRMIIEAMKIVKSLGDAFKMVFAGEGYAAKDMKKMVKQLNLSENIIFMGLVSDRKKLKNLYACADLFIFPSVYDNSPLVIREAAAFNVPSVVVEGSSAAEGILDGINGFLVQNDADALARKIKGLIKNTTAVLRAGEGARKSAMKPWEAVVDDVYHRYTDIISDFGKRKKN